MKSKTGCSIDSQELWDLIDTWAVEVHTKKQDWENSTSVSALLFGRSQLIGELSSWVREREVEAALAKAEEN